MRRAPLNLALAVASGLLENPAIKADAVAAVLFEATAAGARGADRVYVVVDGTALTLGRGDAEERAHASQPATPVRGEECANFVRAAKNAVERLAKVKVRACIVIDREADNSDILFALGPLDCDFIVRSKYDRRLDPRSTLTLKEALKEQPPLGRHEVEIGRTGRRSARKAIVMARAVSVSSRQIRALRTGRCSARTPSLLLLRRARWIEHRAVARRAVHGRDP